MEAMETMAMTTATTTVAMATTITVATATTMAMATEAKMAERGKVAVDPFFPNSTFTGKTWLSGDYGYDDGYGGRAVAILDI